METMIFCGLEIFSSHRPASHCYTYRTFSIMVGVSARACVLLPWLLRPVGGACLLAEPPFERNRTRELSQTTARIKRTPFIPILLVLAASMKTRSFSARVQPFQGPLVHALALEFCSHELANCRHRKVRTSLQISQGISGEWDIEGSAPCDPDPCLQESPDSIQDFS